MRQSVITRATRPLRFVLVVVVGGVEWWSRQEVADYLGVSVETVGSYKSREQMPEPTMFGGSPMWERAVIEAWREPGKRGPGGRPASEA